MCIGCDGHGRSFDYDFDVWGDPSSRDRFERHARRVRERMEHQRERMERARERMERHRERMERDGDCDDDDSADDQQDRRRRLREALEDAKRRHEQEVERLIEEHLGGDPQ
jgi:hypothetical protein